MSQSLVPASSTASSTVSSTYLASQAAARGLGASTSTSLISGDRRKIHTSFTQSGSEMIEEYDLVTDALLLRRLRHKSNLGAYGPWIYEVGEPVAKFNAEKDIVMEASNNPLFVRQDTPSHFQFRIRNLPYEYDNYIVEIDDATQEIVLKTKNKKYYKRMSIPDLKVCGPTSPHTRLTSSSLTYKHAHNTLIISYTKPQQILDLEQKNRAVIKQMGNGDTLTSGDVSAAKPGQKALPSGSVSPQSVAQAIVAQAQANTAAEKSGKGNGGKDEFAGLKGLKGLAGTGRDDCKTQ